MRPCSTLSTRLSPFRLCHSSQWYSTNPSTFLFERTSFFKASTLPASSSCFGHSHRGYHQSHLTWMRDDEEEEEDLPDDDVDAKDEALEDELELRAKHLSKEEKHRLHTARQEHLAAIRETYLEQMRDYYGPPRPVLSSSIKEEIYELHTSDPKRWNLDRLALRYGLRKPRIKAFIRFQKMRAKVREDGYVLDDSLEKLVEKTFGVVDRHPDKNILAESRASRPSNEIIDEDADQAKFIENMRRNTKKDWIFRRQLPSHPPKERKAMDGKVLYAKQQSEVPVQRERRGPLYLVERDDRKTGLIASPQSRTILVNEGDGVVRTATWEERKKIHRQVYHIQSPQLIDAKERQHFPPIYDGWDVPPDEAEQHEGLPQDPKEREQFIASIVGIDPEDTARGMKAIQDKFPQLSFTKEDEETLREEIKAQMEHAIDRTTTDPSRPLDAQPAGPYHERTDGSELYYSELDASASSAAEAK